MNRIHDYLPNFFNDTPIKNELEVSSIAVGSLKTNQFYLGWEQGNLNELRNKFTATDNLEIGFNEKKSCGVKNNKFFYKSPYYKYNYRFDATYHMLDTIPVDWIVDSYKNTKVLYKYNSEWFRSDHFKKEHKGLHILFSGCSNTEGVGANIEDTWSYMLYKELSKTNNIDGYYNIAKSGSGWHTIVQNFMVYANKYGAPDYFFILHPNILRYFVWKEDGSGWEYSSEGPKEDELSGEHKKQFPTWVISFNVFLKYCESVGTRVLWSTWDANETDNIERVSVFNDTFFRINSITNQTIKNNNYYDLMEREDAGNARDGSHDGYIQQYYWFQMFKEEIEKRKMIKMDLLDEV